MRIFRIHCVVQYCKRNRSPTQLAAVYLRAAAGRHTHSPRHGAAHRLRWPPCLAYVLRSLKAWELKLPHGATSRTVFDWQTWIFNSTYKLVVCLE